MNERVLEPGILAPGAPLDFTDGDNIRRGGLAAVVQIDEILYLLTCGHHFPSPGDTVRLRGESLDAAVFDTNLLEKKPEIDASLYRVNAAGLELLDNSRSAPTWTRKFMVPYASHVGREVVFRPAFTIEQNSIATTLNGHDETVLSLLFSPANQNLCRTDDITEDGDSGSILMLGDSSYGLCTGQAHGYSYFTSIFRILLRIVDEKGTQEVSLWIPDTD